MSQSILHSLPQYITHNTFEISPLCKKVTEDSIMSLALLNKNRVLELGHGLCTHLPFLMQQVNELKYFGMEISEELVRKAAKLNKRYVNDSNALFQTYDGFNIPYVHNIFDRILSINTLYYYKDPLEYFNELYRCLKHGGVCVVSFSDTVFLENLKIIEDKVLFNFYDKNKLMSILELSNFSMFNIQENKERIKTKNGNWADKDYYVIILRKEEKSRYLR